MQTVVVVALAKITKSLVVDQLPSLAEVGGRRNRLAMRAW